MTDIIVLVILVILVGGASAYIINAKKSGVKCIGCPAGGSCPGSRKLPKKKLAGPVIGKKTMKISGMSCEHCAANVTSMLNQIDGVRAEVDLSKSRARVFYDREVDDEELKNAVEKIGYQVTDIR